MTLIPYWTTMHGQSHIKFTLYYIWIRCMYCVGPVHLWVVCSSSQDKVLAMLRVMENVQCTVSYLHSIHSAMLCPSPTHNTETKRIWMFVLHITHWANYKTHLNLLTGRQLYRCIVPKSYIQSKSAPEDGRACCPKHVVKIQIDQ